VFVPPPPLSNLDPDEWQRMFARQLLFAGIMFAVVLPVVVIIFAIALWVWY